MTPDCKCLDIPKLSTDAARRTFHRIYDNNNQPDLVEKILEQLDFRPLSVTLLATVALQNKWHNNRLAREWEKRVLRPKHNESFTDPIEPSLTSPLFKDLCNDARDLLEVIAFFTQSVKTVSWYPYSPDWQDSVKLSDRSTGAQAACVQRITH